MPVCKGLTQPERTLANVAGLLPHPAGYNPNGWMLGAHVGSNYQINQIVVGPEVDLGMERPFGLRNFGVTGTLSHNQT